MDYPYPPHRESYERFLNQDLTKLFNQYSPFTLLNNQQVFYTNHTVEKISFSEEEAKKKYKTFGGILTITVILERNGMREERKIELEEIVPFMTQSGTFLISSKPGKTPTVEKVPVAQIKSDIKKNGFPDVNHLKNCKMRFIGDFLTENVEKVLRVITNKEIENFESFSKNLKTWLTKALKSVFSDARIVPILDQTNLLSEFSQKRLVTFLGPGGVNGKRGNFDKRNVHHSHYGRICLLETPESDKIGLNLHFGKYVIFDKNGTLFAEYKDKEGRDILISPKDEEKTIAFFQHASGMVRKGSEIVKNEHFDLEDKYIDQFLGWCASLVPFIHHDAGERAIMGAKNMKQALPLKDPEPPLIKTGAEKIIAKLSGRAIYAEMNGEVEEISENKILIKTLENKYKIYNLTSLSPTNKETCIYHRAVVKEGDKVKKGQILADGAGMKDGSLALGKNLLVAYMPWFGYTFEDGIVISKRLVKEDVFTSIHVKELEVKIWGDEEPHLDVSSPFGVLSQVLGLDENGIVCEGREVNSGDILVRKHKVRYGHIKKDEYVDFKVPSGVKGKVLKPKYIRFVENLQFEDPSTLKGVVRVPILEEKKIKVGDKLTGRHGNKGVVTKIVSEKEMPYFIDEKYGKIDNKNSEHYHGEDRPHIHVDILLNPHGVVSRMNLGQILETHFGWIAKRHPEKEVRKWAKEMGKPFCRVNYDELAQRLEESGVVDREGKTKLYFYMSGKIIEIKNPVVVGYQYIMKLNHLAEDKIHARERSDKKGYATITQQPVKGKKRGGGMRLGHMEIWALIAHQVPHLLKEFLTTKSDDIVTRTNPYSKNICLPESWRAFISYLRGIGLNLKLISKDGKEFPDVIETIEIDNIAKAKIDVASENDIRKWSFGEVKKGKIFKTSVREHFSCLCGKLKGEKNKGRRCKKCGTLAKLKARRETIDFEQDGLFCPRIFGKRGTFGWRTRFGHIELGIPILNPLFKNEVEKILKEKIQPYFDFEKFVDTLKGGLWGSEAILFKIQNLGKEFKKDIFLRVLPVIPPDFRPCLVQKLDKRRIRGDVNVLYQEVINANNRLKKLEKIKADEDVKIKAKLRLHQAVEALILKGMALQEKFHKSLSHFLKGKEGILRHSILAKRQNFSGRAVIVVDPELKIEEFGLPLNIAKIIFKNFIIEEMLKRGIAHDEHHADYILSTNLKENDVAIIVEEFLKKKEPVFLLNRYPSLHKYNIQAFKPKLVRKCAISIHPLVCKGFNADFDGDEMTIYFPIWKESQKEAERCFPHLNLFSVANGNLMLHFAQEIILGLYLLVCDKKEALRKFIPEGIYTESMENIVGSNKKLHKKLLNDIFTKVYQLFGPNKAKEMAEKITKKALEKATVWGLTFSIFDVKEISLNKQEKKRFMSQIDVEKVKNLIKRIEEKIEEKISQHSNNPISLMYLSGARGNMKQISQIAGARGFVEVPEGVKVPPIWSNFFEGLYPWEYFVSMYGARRTLMDKKLKTADAGDLTNRLVEAGYSWIIKEKDCNSDKAIKIKLEDGNIVGRVAFETIKDEKGNVIVSKNEIITEESAEKIRQLNLDEVKIRSPLTCKVNGGLCSYCYGWDLSKRKLPEVGFPAGIIAGQSIGERGTQLTMRTFHKGGIKEESITEELPLVESCFENRFKFKKEKLQDLLNQGLDKFYERFMQIMHAVYKKQIDDRHFEVILRTMLQYPGKIMGITKVGKEQRSFLATAAFRDAIKVLKEAAWEGKEDNFQGVKEKMMLGLAV